MFVHADVMMSSAMQLPLAKRARRQKTAETSQGLSSIEPDGSGGGVDCGEEVSSRLVAARGDSLELLQLREEVLDQVPFLCRSLFMQIAIIVALDRTARLGRDHSASAGSSQQRQHPLIGIERLVGDQPLGIPGWQQ